MKKILSFGLTLVALSASCKANIVPQGPYAQVMIGPNWSDFHTSKYKPAHLDVKQGFMAGASFGMRFCRGFRIEEEYSYRHARFIVKGQLKKNNKGKTARPHARAHYQTSAVLANLLLDLPFSRCRFTPYIGGGVGYGWNSARVGKGSCAVQSSLLRRKYTSRGFAWQGIAGVTIPLNRHTGLGLEYRYFTSTAHLRSQAFIVASRFNF